MAVDPEEQPLLFQMDINGTLSAPQSESLFLVDSETLAAGSHTVLFTVDDGLHRVSSQPFNITISPNNAPEFIETAEIPEPISHISPETVTLTYRAVDSDNDPLTYTLFHNQQPIDSNQTGTFLVFTLPDIIIADQYTCSVSDGFTTTTSNPVMVQTYDPTTQPVAIADPIGLGERLALRQWLKDAGQLVDTDTDIATLRRLYLIAQVTDYELRREAIILERDRLRRVLSQDFDHQVSQDATINEMKRALLFYQLQEKAVGF